MTAFGLLNRASPSASRVPVADHHLQKSLTASQSYDASQGLQCIAGSPNASITGQPNTTPFYIILHALRADPRRQNSTESSLNAAQESRCRCHAIASIFLRVSPMPRGMGNPMVRHHSYRFSSALTVVVVSVRIFRQGHRSFTRHRLRILTMLRECINATRSRARAILR